MAHIGQRRGSYSVLVGKPEGQRDYLKHPGINGKIELKRILKESVWRAWTVLMWSGQGQVAGTCECDNKPSGSIKCGEFLT
jgi:hypothetical protein